MMQLKHSKMKLHVMYLEIISINTEIDQETGILFKAVIWPNAQIHVLISRAGLGSVMTSFRL